MLRLFIRDSPAANSSRRRRSCMGYVVGGGAGECQAARGVVFATGGQSSAARGEIATLRHEVVRGWGSVHNSRIRAGGKTARR